MKASSSGLLPFISPASAGLESSPAANLSGPDQSQIAIDSGRITRFTAGDESAFVEIMQDNHDRLFAIVLNMLHNHGDTEEIVQDTFIRAHRGLATFRRESSLRTWLYRIATNLARNRYWYFQRRFRHASVSLDCPLEGATGGSREFGDLISNGSPDPAHEAAQQEFGGLMNRCLAQLEPAHRGIITQRFVKNLSYAEIGAALGIRAGTVKSRLARARQRLRLRMAETCPEISLHEWIRPYREANAGSTIAAA
jgi:RNA polymerase sigma-70 factor (ECF subfamily)